MHGMEGMKWTDEPAGLWTYFSLHRGRLASLILDISVDIILYPVSCVSLTLYSPTVVRVFSIWSRAGLSRAPLSLQPMF